MAAEGYECLLDPVTSSTLRLYLYKDVHNIEQIKKNVLEGKWPCTVIKPSLILDPLQIEVAANKAAVSQKDGSMITRSLFSEILFNLSLTKNICQSLIKFGIEKDENILVAFVDTGEGEEQRERILAEIQGVKCPITDLEKFTDLKDIKKVYRLDKVQCKNEDLLDLIVSRMATKNFVSH